MSDPQKVPDGFVSEDLGGEVRFRVRLDGRWLDVPNGSPLYVVLAAASNVVPLPQAEVIGDGYRYEPPPQIDGETFWRLSTLTTQEVEFPNPVESGDT